MRVQAAKYQDLPNFWSPKLLVSTGPVGRTMRSLQPSLSPNSSPTWGGKEETPQKFELCEVSQWQPSLVTVGAISEPYSSAISFHCKISEMQHESTR